MPLRFFFFLLLQIFLANSSATQTPDSFTNREDTALVRQWVEKGLRQQQDSIDAVRIKTEVKKHGKPLDVFLQEMREKEQARKRQLYIRIGLGTLFLIVVIAGLLRRKKLSSG